MTQGLTKENNLLANQLIDYVVEYVTKIRKVPYLGSYREILLSSVSTQVKKSITIAFICYKLSGLKWNCIVYGIRDNLEVDAIGRKLRAANNKAFEITSSGPTVSEDEFVRLIKEGHVFYTHVDQSRLNSKNLQNYHSASFRLRSEYPTMAIYDDPQEYLFSKDYSGLSEESIKDVMKILPKRDIALEANKQFYDINIWVTTTVASFVTRATAFDKVYELTPPPEHAGWDDITYYASQKNNKHYTFDDYLVKESIPRDEPRKSLFDDTTFADFIEDTKDRKKLQHILACVGDNTRDLYEAAVGTAIDIKKRGLPYGVIVCAGQEHDVKSRSNNEDDGSRHRNRGDLSNFWEITVDENLQPSIENLGSNRGETFQHAASYMTEVYKKFITFDFEMITKMAKSPVDLEGRNPATVFYNTRSGTANGMREIQRTGRLCGDYPDTNKARFLICPQNAWDFLQTQLADNAKLINFFKDTEGLPYDKWEKERTLYLQLDGKNHTKPVHGMFTHGTAKNDFKIRYKTVEKLRENHKDTHLITRQITVPDFDPPNPGTDGRNYFHTHILPAFDEFYLQNSDLTDKELKEMQKFKKQLDACWKMCLVSKSGESVRIITDEYYARYFEKDLRAMAPSKKGAPSPEAWNRIKLYWGDYGLTITIVHPDYTWKSLVDHHSNSYASHDRDGSILYYTQHGSTGFARKKTKDDSDQIAA